MEGADGETPVTRLILRGKRYITQTTSGVNGGKLLKGKGKKKVLNYFGESVDRI